MVNILIHIALVILCLISNNTLWCCVDIPDCPERNRSWWYWYWYLQLYILSRSYFNWDSSSVPFLVVAGVQLLNNHWLDLVASWRQQAKIINVALIIGVGPTGLQCWDCTASLPLLKLNSGYCLQILTKLGFYKLQPYFA